MIAYVMDPHIPYIGAIQTIFIPGKLIKIQGTVPATAYRFNINLQCGPEITAQNGTDIAIQITVKVLEGCFTINAFQHGIWNEERYITTSSFKRTERFEILLVCELHHYQMVINDSYTYELPKRIHHDRISHLVIDGDVSIIKVSYESTGAKFFSNAPPSYEAAIANAMRMPYLTNDANLHLPIGRNVPLNAPRNSTVRPINRMSTKIFCTVFWSAFSVTCIFVYMIVYSHNHFLNKHK